MAAQNAGEKRRNGDAVSGRELPYFQVGGALGWNQDWFNEFWMKIGGCAAVTACDLCVYLKKHRGFDKLYPFSTETVDKEEYRRFAAVMKPYLRPRVGGVNKLCIYTEGLGRYFREVGESRLTLEEFSGERTERDARNAITAQIDRGFPLPFLTLKHKNPALSDYVWHWFLLGGYRQGPNGDLQVKVITYGHEHWLSLAALWDTGYKEKGGMVLLRDGT